MANVVNGQAWHWDSVRNQYYIYVPSQNIYLYGDGSRLPGPNVDNPSSSYSFHSPPPVHGGHHHASSMPSIAPTMRDLSLATGGQMSPSSSPYQTTAYSYPDSSPRDSQLPHVIRASETIESSPASASASLDRRYRIRSADFFRRGRVFRVLWSEPANRPAKDTVITPYGEYTHVKIRWFVVVRDTGQDYSSCLPIQTYGGQGVSKASVKKSVHGIIYTGKKAPKPKTGEKPPAGQPGMLPPVEVKRKSKSDQLDEMSRINYDKIYTVEHNCKVYEVGDIHPSSMEQFLRNFQTVWNQGKSCGASDGEEIDEESEDEDDEEVETEQDTAKKAQILQHLHARLAVAGAENPVLVARHNRFVDYYVQSFRRNGDDATANWLLQASREEQVAYMRKAGADI